MQDDSGPLDLQAALVAAQSAAKAGSQVLLSYFGKLKQVSEKFQAGLVSEADVDSEKAIQAELLKAIPAKFLGEESSQLKSRSWSEGGNWWIVDPLDGTTNYVHGFPVFCISIALMWEGEVVLGLVDVPMIGATYWALKGQGAFLNGKRLRVSDRTTIRNSLLATGFYRDDHEALKEQLAIFTKLVFEARGIRRAGAAAYDLCLVAEGVFDAFWEKHLMPWDTAAGILMVREAGGRVTDYSGNDFNFTYNSVMASNGRLHDEILNTIRKR